MIFKKLFNNLQEEGEEREEQARDGLANCFGALDNRESHGKDILLW